MRIVFFGTPDFAVPSAEKIYNSSHKIAAVVTAPDKERGRGRKISYTPVKEFALKKDIPCLQPESLKDDIFIEELKTLNADLFVIVAFRILPRTVFTLPKYGSFNLHGSVLPKYRGAAPIQWALINGDTETGVTTFFLEDKVDTGNIIKYQTLPIDKNDNLGSLHDKLCMIGADLVLETINLIDEGSVALMKQDNSKASPAPKITKETCQLDFSKSAEKVNNLIRGLSPFPGAFFVKNEKIYKVYKAELVEQTLAAGEIKETKDQLFIGCSSGALEVLEIQPEGRKRMTSTEFLRGYSLTE